MKVLKRDMFFASFYIRVVIPRGKKNNNLV